MFPGAIVVPTQIGTTEDAIGRPCDCRSDDAVELERMEFYRELEAARRVVSSLMSHRLVVQ